MTDDAVTDLLLTGYVALRSEGLALPCYASGPQSNAWYCAVCSTNGDHRGTIIGFTPYDSGDVVLLGEEARRSVSIGDPWHDVLLWNGGTFVGTPEIIVAQLGNQTAELATRAPLTLLDLAMATETLDRAAVRQSARARLVAIWGREEADRWEADGFVRSYLMLEVRRLLRSAGLDEPVDAVRAIQVGRTEYGLTSDIPFAVLTLLANHGLQAALLERVAEFSATTGLELQGPVPVGGDHFAETLVIPELDDISLRDEPPQAIASRALVIGSGRTARRLLRNVTWPDWHADWGDGESDYPEQWRGVSNPRREGPVDIDTIDDRQPLPNLDAYSVVIWLVDDKSLSHSWGRDIIREFVHAEERSLTRPLFVLAPMLPPQQPPRVLGVPSIGADVPPFHILLDTTVVRSPFWSGNSRRSIDRRVADLIGAAAQLLASDTALRSWLEEDRPRYEPLLLSIATGLEDGRGQELLGSEVSSGALESGNGRMKRIERFEWIEIPSGRERRFYSRGVAEVGTLHSDFRPFAEAVVQEATQNRLFESPMLEEVPTSIRETLDYPHLSAAWHAEGSDTNCVIAAEAPSLTTLRAAASVGWTVARYSDRDALRQIGRPPRLNEPLPLPSDILMPKLNRLGRNRGLAVRGADPRDVVRIPMEIYDDWRRTCKGAGLTDSVRWYRSALGQPGDELARPNAVALPVAILREAEMSGDEAAQLLRRYPGLTLPEHFAHPKRPSDLRASWFPPTAGARRWMLEDGRLPPRLTLLEDLEIAAQKFFTIDGDASVPLLFSSRLFRVWAGATVTRSPSWSSRISVTKTFETFPLPDEFIVFNDGEGGRATLKATLRSTAMADLFEAAILNDSDGIQNLPHRLSVQNRKHTGELVEHVDFVMLSLVGLSAAASDLDVLECLTDLNRRAGA